MRKFHPFLYILIPRLDGICNPIPKSEGFLIPFPKFLPAGQNLQPLLARIYGWAGFAILSIRAGDFNPLILWSVP